MADVELNTDTRGRKRHREHTNSIASLSNDTRKSIGDLDHQGFDSNFTYTARIESSADEPHVEIVSAITLDAADYTEISHSELIRLVKKGHTGVAQILEKLAAGRIKWDEKENKFYIWDGNNFVIDSVVVRQMIDAVVRPLLEQLLSCSYCSSSSCSSSSLVGAKRIEQLTKLNHPHDGGTLSLKELRSRINDLGNYGFIKGVMSCLRDQVRIKESEWKQMTSILALMDGYIVDLTTGASKRNLPSYKIKHHYPVEWKGIQEPSPKFDEFMTEVYPDRELREFVLKVIASQILGNPKEHKLYIFYGKGRNGKSTLIGDILPTIFGTSTVKHVTPDVVIEHKKSTAGSAHAHLMALKDTRIVYIADTPKGARFDVDQVKRLTGDKSVSARPLYGDVTNFAVGFTVNVLTNYIPKLGSEADEEETAKYSFLSKVDIIPHNIHFVNDPKAENERQINKNLGEELKAESSGILARLVQWALEYQKTGLTPVPEAVSNAMEEYKSKEEDPHHVRRYLRSLKSGYTIISSSQLHDKYFSWCQANGLTDGVLASTKSFSQYVQKGILPPPSKIGGIMKFKIPYEISYQMFLDQSDEEESFF